MTLRLVYFADPMCSWCWGFSPVIDAVEDRFRDQLPVRPILGGLRPGTTKALDQASKQAIREHWDHVQEASGQPFDFAFFARDGFVYDTEPPSRAVVAARRLNPRTALAFLNKIHRAFYAENRDVTKREALCDLAAEAGVDRETFAGVFDAEETLLETRQDFAIARQAGISGFPTLLAGSDAEGYSVITHGYRPWEKVELSIATWLERARQRSRPPASSGNETWLANTLAH